MKMLGWAVGWIAGLIGYSASAFFKGLKEGFLKHRRDNNEPV